MEQRAGASAGVVPPPGVWVAVSAALAVVVSIFAGLGIEQDLLRRMVRNDPDGVAWAVGLVIVGAALPVILLLVNLSGRRAWATTLTSLVTVFSALLVVVGMINVLRTGTESLHSRDMPSLSLSAVKSPSGAVTVTSEAKAPALRSTEKMLLRIYGIGPSASEDLNVDSLCRGTRWPDIKGPSSGSGVLQWGESGPDKTGTASVQESLVVNSNDYRFVCAYAVLFNAPNEQPYSAWSVVDLRSLQASTPAAAAPSSEPTAPAP